MGGYVPVLRHKDEALCPQSYGTKTKHLFNDWDKVLALEVEHGVEEVARRNGQDFCNFGETRGLTMKKVVIM